MDLIEHLKNYRTYRYYLDYLNDLKKRHMDLRFRMEEFTILPRIFNEYVHFITLPKEIKEDELSNKDLDNIICDNILSLFGKEHQDILRMALATKNIIPEYPSCMSSVDSNSFYIIMHRYSQLSDIANFMHEILHVFIYGAKNPHINSEVMSILFELIALDKIDSLTGTAYLKNHINTLLDSALANIRLLELYPKITPVILPYIKGEYLAYELFLVYKDDPEAFKYHLKNIFDGEESIEHYLRKYNIMMGDRNFAKIEINHKKILTKP